MKLLTASELAARLNHYFINEERPQYSTSLSKALITAPLLNTWLNNRGYQDIHGRTAHSAYIKVFVITEKGYNLGLGRKITASKRFYPRATKIIYDLMMDERLNGTSTASSEAQVCTQGK